MPKTPQNSGKSWTAKDLQQPRKEVKQNANKGTCSAPQANTGGCAGKGERGTDLAEADEPEPVQPEKEVATSP